MKRTVRWLGDSSRWDRVAVLWLVMAVTAVMFVFDDFGTTFDEDKHVKYGNMVLAWFTTGFDDERALSYSRDYLYGGAFDMAGAAFRRVVPLETYDAMHLLGGLVGWLGLLGTWRLGRRLGGPAVGCVALILLSITPTYVGHAFNNPKDSPFAVGYVWGLVGIADIMLRAPHPRWRDWLRVGALVGLSASVRVAGLLSFCYLGLATAFLFSYGRRLGRFVEVRDFGRLLGSAAASMALGWLVMIAAWPWAQLQPLSRPIFALRYMSTFALAPHQIPFNGRQIYGFEVPWDYIPRLLALKLPEVVLVGVAAALLVIPWALRSGSDLRRSAAWGLLGISILLPPAYAIAKGSTLYGGIRHFLFIQPPLAVVAAAGLVVLTRWAWVKSPGLGWALAVTTALGMAVGVRTIARLHPLQYIHFNRLAGGIAGANNRFELDYYGAGYKPAVEQFLAELWIRDPDVYLAPTVRYAGCGGGSYLPPNFVKDKKPADFHIGSTRGSCRDKHEDRPVYTALIRDGVPIVVVRDLRDPTQKDSR